MENAIEVHDLRKSFSGRAGRVDALQGLSLQIPAGGIVHGILGKNGAGKSTLFRILMGMSEPDTGSVRVLGAPPASHAILGRIGATIETPCFFDHLTGLETLAMLCLLHGPDRSARPAELLERVGLAESAQRKVEGYSVGMKQRLALAAALISRPEVVVLDEPGSGMDFIGLQSMWQLLRDLAERDRVSVVLTSHQMQEIARVCDAVSILRDGRVATEGRVSELLQGRSRLRLVARPMEPVLQKLGALAARDGDAVVASVTLHEAPELLASLLRDGVEVYEARWITETLESVVLGHFGNPANA